MVGVVCDIAALKVPDLQMPSKWVGAERCGGQLSKHRAEWVDTEVFTRSKKCVHFGCPRIVTTKGR